MSKTLVLYHASCRDGFCAGSARGPSARPTSSSALCQGHPFAVGWSQRADGLFTYSLRSAEGGLDVSVIAKRHGGGGHPHAAGFTSAKLLF